MECQKRGKVLQPTIRSIFFITFLLVSYFYVSIAEGAITEFEQKRAELLSKLISQQMIEHHYLHPAFDDELSQKIFSSYLQMEVKN